MNCKDCRSFQLVLAYDFYQGNCLNEKIRAPEDEGMNKDQIRIAGELWVGGWFGCVHWEAKDGYKETPHQ